MRFISDSITRMVATKITTTKQQSPHIFFAAGVAGVIGATYLACKATLKLETTLDEIKHDVENVKDYGTEVKNDAVAYSEAEYAKDLVYVYGKATNKIVRLYGPAVIVGSVSIASLAGSHIQLTRRNTALTATVAALSKAYEEYRDRVREAIGDERELDLHRGVSEEEQKIDGKKEVVKVIDPNASSIYARLFDESNINWVKDVETNKLFIQCQQNWMNNRLHAKGHVFLNEVYDCLGLERSTAGQFVGWTAGGDGDDYIDFGLFEARSKDFQDGREPRIWLDFNVDGPIYDKF